MNPDIHDVVGMLRSAAPEKWQAAVHYQVTNALFTAAVLALAAIASTLLAWALWRHKWEDEEARNLFRFVSACLLAIVAVLVIGAVMQIPVLLNPEGRWSRA